MKKRTTGIMIGGLAGALVGSLIAWILLDQGDANRTVGAVRGPTRAIKPTDVVSLAGAALTLVRQVSVLRQR